MSKAIRIRKGLDIRLQGKALEQFGASRPSDTVAIRPTNFQGLTPKMVVKAGDKVKAGSTLFHDKYNPRIQFTSPVSGEVLELVRGERRRILEVKIQADKQISYENFGAGDPDKMSSEDVKEKLLKSGVWPFIRQRPFSCVADPNVAPKAIVVSATDTHPLAPYNDFIVNGQEAEFQAGLDVLTKLTAGKVHLTMVAGERRSKAFLEAKNVVKHGFSGPHPAGNVGTQIHHIDPINKGEFVWYLYPQDVLVIGRLFLSGKFDARRTVALTGSEVATPQYYQTILGAPVAPMIRDNITHDNVRYISGNPLTGEQISEKGYVGFYDTQVTVLPEGNQYKFVATEGWMSPGFNKFSANPSFMSAAIPGSADRRWRLDTNTNGEKRAFVITGQYEEVFPLDIYPQLLVKACITENIDAMEKLGIYEVDAEDFALCEFVCTSKTDAMAYIRAGLELCKKECF